MPEKQKISVLMSVYVKENPTFLRDAIKSVQNQTLKPSELVLVEDGPLTPELYQVLDEVEAQSDIPVKRCPLEQNQGLGLALRYGVLQCQYDIIARMDTDDLAVPDRFEKQLQLMEKEDLDLLGGHIAEFIDNPDEIVSDRVLSSCSNSARRHCGLPKNEKCFQPYDSDVQEGYGPQGGQL